MRRLLRRSQHGQNLVETALAIPILFLFLAGVVDLGRLFNNYMIVANATREGARVAMRLPCRNDSTFSSGYIQVIRDSVLNELAGHPEVMQGDALTESDILISVGSSTTEATACPTLGQDITVRVTYTFPFWMTSILGSGSITLSPFTTVQTYVWTPTPEGR
jgi:Flp pilus assembly protein TadG